MRFKRRLTTIAITAGVALSGSLISLPGYATLLTVAPNDRANAAGNAQSPTPLRFPGTGGSRVQQLYSSAFFSAPQTITGIQFRPTPGIAPSALFGDTISVSDITIRLSTTSRGDEGADTLSMVFANNIGDDVTTVYSDPLTLTTAFTGPPGGPKAFDYSIALEQPFFYDPGLGNLLLDAMIPTGATVSGNGFFGFITLDQVNDLNDGIFSIVNLSDGGANSGIASTAGAITRFVGEPVAVPEPGMLPLFAVGFLMLGLLGRRGCRDSSLAQRV